MLLQLPTPILIKLCVDHPVLFCTCRTLRCLVTPAEDATALVSKMGDTSALTWAIQHEKRHELLSILQHAGDSDIAAALDTAVRARSPLYEDLLHMAKEDDAYNALTTAACNGQVEVCKTISSVIKRDVHLQIYMAACNGHVGASQSMCRTTEDYHWALMGASGGGHLDFCRSLITQNSDLDTALCFAARFGRTDACGWLIDMGATQVQRAICNAMLSDKVETAEFLMQHESQLKI